MIENWLNELKSKDIYLYLEDDRLKFNAPKGRMTDELKSSLKENKEKLIHYFQELGENKRIKPRGDAAGPAPLSYSQQRLWFLNQLEEDSSSYNMYKVYRILGELDVQALSESLKKIVNRHDILRTNFIQVDKQLQCRIHKKIDHCLLFIEDISGLTEKCRRQMLETRIQEESKYNFNLERDLLFRFRLMRSGKNEYHFILVMHHIVFDAWSESIFIKELIGFYRNLSGDGESFQEDLPIQYSDYAAWQYGRMDKDDWKKSLAYWKKRLSGVNSCLELPTDYPRPAIQTFNGSSLKKNIDPELARALSIFASQRGCTLFMVMFSAFITQLHLYTCANDISVGTTIAGRNRKEIEPLIGFFVNTIVLRSFITGENSFEQVLEQVKTHSLESYNHQDIPFEKIVEVIQPERSLSYSPLFQVMFDLINVSMDEIILPGLILQPMEFDNKTSKFDLTLAILEQKGALVMEWEYNSDMFRQTTVELMAKHYQSLLREILDDFECPVSKYTFLDDYLDSHIDELKKQVIFNN